MAKKYVYVDPNTVDNPHANPMWIHHGFETDFGWVCPHCEQHVKRTGVWLDKESNTQICLTAYKLKQMKSLRDTVIVHDHALE